MDYYHLSPRFRHGILVLAMSFALAPLTFGDTPFGVNIAWQPITDEDKALAAPKVEKNAGLEAIFWHVHVIDEVSDGKLQRNLYHYVRLKVFNKEGAEKASTLNIPYSESESVLYIQGRTIKANGDIVELTKDAIHDRDIFRIGGLKRKVKSLAMPAVEPGAIVEYRWKEVRYDGKSFYMRVQFQREYPIQKVTYYVMPISRRDYGL